MPTNNLTKEGKAAVKRRQRARIKRGEMIEREKALRTDLSGLELEEGIPGFVKRAARMTREGYGVTSKLTPKLASKIISLIAQGNSPPTSAAACGIARSTFAKWMKEAEEALAEAEPLLAEALEKMEATLAEAEQSVLAADAEGDDEKAEEAFNHLETVRQAAAGVSILQLVPIDRLKQVHLSLMVQMAEAKAETTLLAKASEGERGWQGAMAILERRFRADWGKKSEIDHNVVGDKDRPVVFAFEANDERQRQVAAVLSRQNALEDPGKGTDAPGGGLPLIEHGDGDLGQPA